jgi:hypothetical protein
LTVQSAEVGRTASKVEPFVVVTDESQHRLVRQHPVVGVKLAAGSQGQQVAPLLAVQQQHLVTVAEWVGVAWMTDAHGELRVTAGRR